MVALSDTIRRNAYWLIGSTMIRRILQFGISIVLARLLLPADFGLVVTMSIFTGIAGYFAAGGMGDALIRAATIKDSDYAVVFTMQLLICVVIYAGFVLVAPAFAEWFEQPIYELLLPASALTFLLRPFLNVPTSRLNREMRFRTLSLLRVATLIWASATSITLAWQGFGAWSLVCGGLSGAAFTIPIALWCARWRPSIRFEAAAYTTLGKTGVKFSANHIVEYLKTQTGNFIVSHAMGPAMVGLYNRADGLVALPRELIISSSHATLFRGLAKVQDDVQMSRYLFLRSLTLFSVYTMPIYVGLWWLADPFVPFAYGPHWAGAVEPLRILALSGLFLVGNPSSALISAQGRLGRAFAQNVETFVVMAAACLIGSRYGLEGLAAGTVLSRFYTGLRQYQLAASCVGASLRDLVRALAPAYILCLLLFAAMGAAQFLFDPLLGSQPFLYLLATAGAAAVFYFGVFLFLPLKSLAGEVKRWRALLRLPARS